MSKGRIWIAGIVLSAGAVLAVCSLYCIFVLNNPLWFSIYLSGGLLAGFISFVLYSSILVGAELKLAAKFLNKINRLSKDTYEENNERLNRALETIRKVYPAQKQIITSILVIQAVFLTTVSVFSGIFSIWILLGFSIVLLAVLTVYFSLKLKFLNRIDLDYRSLMKLTEEKDGTMEKKNNLLKLEMVNVKLGEDIINRVYETNTVNTIICKTADEKKAVIDTLMFVKTPEAGQIYFDGKNAAQIIAKDKFKYIAIINEKNIKFNFEGDNNITLFDSFSEQRVDRVKREITQAFKGGDIKTISYDSLTRAVLKDAAINVIDGDFSLKEKESAAQLRALVELLPDKIIFVVKTK